MKKVLNFVLVIFCYCNLFGQNPPCAPNFPYQTYQVPRLINYPPYSLDMPYDVLIGYVALDTISHYSNKLEVKNFLERQTFNDTLKKIMRHYYSMVDFDPIKYKQASFFRNNSIQCCLGNIDNEIDKTIKKHSPYPLLDYMLCSSHYILHIKAKFINVIDDTTTSGPVKEVREIYSEVLDTMKGKKIPYIAINPPLSKPDVKKPQINLLIPPGNYFVFDYSRYWGDLVNEQGQSWIKVDSEYIVFLSNIEVCQDSLSGYFHIRPRWPELRTFGLYPIIDGEVYDPRDDFNFGIGLTPTKFKDSLRARTNQILSF